MEARDSGHTVFVVDDDAAVCDALGMLLRAVGMDVETFRSAASFLKALRPGQSGCLVLDIRMPGMSGLEVCRAIRAREDRTPILMLTALDSVEQRIAGLDEGADDYLTKPFDFGELLARVRALTRRHGESASAQLTVGDLVIDLRRHTVHRGTREISLTAKEFAFLVYLARNAGTVVSRADLMAHVWDDSRSTAYSNIIDVYASRLRRKLDDGEVEPLFSTLRGTGFVLEAPAGSRRSGAAKRPE